MADTGKYLHGVLVNSKPRMHMGKCQNCGYTLELYEIDIRKSTKTMKCERCGLLHHYRKDILGKWRLQRATRADLTR